MNTSPLIPRLMVAPEGPTSAPGAEQPVSGEFGSTLGAALATVLAGAAPTPPPPIAAPRLEPVAGDWTLDAERPDQPAEGPGREGVVPKDGQRPSVTGLPVVDPHSESLSLERGLDLWLTRIAEAPAQRDGPESGETVSKSLPNGVPKGDRPEPAETGFGFEIQIQPADAAPVPPAGVLDLTSRAAALLRPVAEPLRARADPAPTTVESSDHQRPALSRPADQRRPPRASLELADPASPPPLLGSANHLSLAPPLGSVTHQSPRPLVGPGDRPSPPSSPAAIEPPPAMDLDQGVSVAVMLGRRAAAESVIEIAGFDFPPWSSLASIEPPPSAPTRPPVGAGPAINLATAPELAAPATPSEPRVGRPDQDGAPATPPRRSPPPAPAGVTSREEIREFPSQALSSVSPRSSEVAVEPRRVEPGRSRPEPEPPRVIAPRAAPVDEEASAGRHPDAGDRDQRGSRARPNPPEPVRRPGADPLPPELIRPVLGPMPTGGGPRGRGTVGSPGPAAATGLEPSIKARREDLILPLGDDQTDLGRVRVAIRGPTVRATIMPNDPELASRLTVNLRELRQSLEDRGFPEPRITVQAPRPLDSVAPTTAARDLVAEAGASSDPKSPTRHSASDDRRERGSEPSARQDQRHRQPDRPRHYQQEEETDQ